MKPRELSEMARISPTLISRELSEMTRVSPILTSDRGFDPRPKHKIALKFVINIYLFNEPTENELKWGTFASCFHVCRLKEILH